MRFCYCRWCFLTWFENLLFFCALLSSNDSLCSYQFGLEDGEKSRPIYCHYKNGAKIRPTTKCSSNHPFLWRGLNGWTIFPDIACPVCREREWLFWSNSWGHTLSLITLLIRLILASMVFLKSFALILPLKQNFLEDCQCSSSAESQKES